MKKPLFLSLLLFLLLLSSFCLFAQKRVSIPWRGMVLLQEEGAPLPGECLFCQPELMPDRIVLDSNKRMVARKTSNPFGYTYYEWRNKDYSKSYQEIQLLPMTFICASRFSESSSENPKEKNSPHNSYLSYFRAPHNKKEPYNGSWTVNRLQVQLNRQEMDSLAKVYACIADSLRKGGVLWRELNFYENGCIQSSGILLFPGLGSNQSPSMRAPNNTRYKIGLWLYYEGRGRKIYQEHHQKPVPTH